MISAKKYLARVLGIEVKKFDEALRRAKDYKRKEIPKDNGKVRVVFAPNYKLRKVQKQILRRFLYLFDVDERLHAFVRGRSNVTNAIYHANGLPRFVLRMDFKDAFPSVRSEHLRPILGELVQRKGLPHFGSLASFERTPENEESPPQKALEEILDILLALTTLADRLPQGAPTSPYLLNLVVTHCGLLNEIDRIVRKYLSANNLSQGEPPIQPRISFYSDDLCVSSRKSIPVEMAYEIASAIENTGIFKVNWKKTLFFNRKQGSPMITGLRISSLFFAPAVVRHFLEKKRHGKQAVDALDSLNGKGEIPRVCLPKKYIRKVRGLIYRAVAEKELRPVARGHVLYIQSVCGKNLPQQIRSPLAKLAEAVLNEKG